MPSLFVRAAPPGTTVQDAGRSGWLSAGVPPGGPLDPAAHAAANLAVGNDAREAALEVMLGELSIGCEGSVTVSIDGGAPTSLGGGDELTVPACSRAVRYLAVRGGIDVPALLGSRATLVTAGFGGLDGRPLRKGDVLPVGTRAGAHFGTAFPSATDPGDPALLYVSEGPHAARFSIESWAELFAASWIVSARSNRVGVRLEGAAISRSGDDRAPPAPMRRGAIQITTDGTPIVLGPDHPVTGGYPVLAVVGRASQAVLARVRPGRAVRFARDDGF